MPSADDVGGKAQDTQNQPSLKNIQTHSEPVKNSGKEIAKTLDNKLDRDMVFWTRAVGVFTALLVFSSLLQYFAMRGQQAVMQSQLNEMVRQESITKAQMLPDMRDLDFMTMPTSESGKVTGLSVTPVWENVGGTPANKFTQAWRWQFWPNGSDESKFCETPPFTDKLATSSRIPPGQKFSLPYQIIPEQIVENVAAGNGQIVLSGGFFYRDIFSDDPLQVIVWCTLMTPKDGSGTSFIYQVLK